jgi:hypothetical protein
LEKISEAEIFRSGKELNVRKPCNSLIQAGRKCTRAQIGVGPGLEFDAEVWETSSQLHLELLPDMETRECQNRDAVLESGSERKGF